MTEDESRERRMERALTLLTMADPGPRAIGLLLLEVLDRLEELPCRS
jgi:hypothetical protein